jgi:hypothetical protein
MKRNRKFSLERLEDRQLMAGDLVANAFGGLDVNIRDRAIPVIPAVPAYSSNPGAAATLYLDFNGHFQAQWWTYSNIVTPVFSIDADTTTFSSTELATIKEVWQRVSEDFAPFNINVTTVNPGNFDNGKALRVAIGGSWKDWYHEAGGVGLYDSFTDGDPNVVYVFRESNFYSAKGFSGTVSHEAGHAFGLRHQSSFDANGQVIEEYRSGTDQKGPIMGKHRDSVRTTWAYGQSSYRDIDNNVIDAGMQDDMAVIASNTNGFGYRPDDLGNTWQTALPMGQLSSYGPIWDQYGIIGATSDTDWFQFNVMNDGRLSLQVEGAQVGANLDAKLSLFRLEDRLVNGKPVFSLFHVATSDPATSLNASLARNLTPGNYYAVVASHGEYGDVGQFTLTGNFSAPLTVNPGIIVNGTLKATASFAPTTPTTIPQTTLVSSSNVGISSQLLAAPTPSRDTSPMYQSTSNLATTSISQRAAAIDEALTTRVRMKTHMLPEALFDLLAAA